MAHILACPLQAADAVEPETAGAASGIAAAKILDTVTDDGAAAAADGDEAMDEDDDDDGGVPADVRAIIAPVDAAELVCRGAGRWRETLSFHPWVESNSLEPLTRHSVILLVFLSTPGQLPVSR